jgi:uncharacterized protein (TIGR00255 family)
MTGFARVQTETPEFTLTVSVKSVNHRFLDVQARLPADLEAFEVAARQAIKKRVTRGSLQLSASVEMRGGTSIAVRRHLVDGYLAAYRELAQAYGVSAEPDLNAVFRLPGVVSWSEPGAAQNGNLEAVLLETLERALSELNRFREREAGGIVEEMEARSRAIDAALDRIGTLREGVSRVLLERLTQRLNELLQAAAPDPQRILQEAALLADRSDVSEEVQRLRVHNRQLRDLVRSEGDLGKKLDFLLQEMNREANTIVSKTSGLGQTGLEITDLGLSLKAEIEKIREQGMNLE